MPRRKNKNKRSIVKPIVLFAVGIGIGIMALAVMLKLLFTKHPYFNISKVTIKPQEAALDDGFSKFLIGKNIFSVNLIDIKKQIEKESLDTECVLIQRSMPSELALFLKQRVAIAQLKAPRFYRIDSSGAIMEGASDIAFPDLPIIVGLEGRIKVKDNKGSSIEELRQAIELIQEKNNSTYLNNYRIAKINISKDMMSSLSLAKDSLKMQDVKNNAIAVIEVKFDLARPRETIRVLGLLLNKYNGKLEDIEYVDLKNLNSPLVLEKKTVKGNQEKK